MSLYQQSVPSFIRLLTALSTIIDKAAAHCAARKIDPVALINFRFYPDMFAFKRQIQVACDQVTRGCARLTGSEVPSNPDVEETFEQLQARIKKTIDYAKSLPESKYEGAETRDIVVKTSSGERHYKGLDYLRDAVTPNFFFHITTAYNMLRHNGIDIGKNDFLGKP